MLLRLGDFQSALADCFTPILATSSEDIGLVGVQAVTIRVCAELGSVESSYELLLQKDARLRHSISADTMRLLLARARDAMGSCLKTESLYWVVLNGTRLCYKMCACLMRPERAALAIEALAWCALCMEGMMPLLTLEFLPWRIQIYSALCHCYEAAGMLGGAQKAAAHAQEHLASLRKLDRHDPVPPSLEMRAQYTEAEAKLAALAAKYKWLQSPDDVPAEPVAAAKAPAKGKGEPAPEAEESVAISAVRGVSISAFGDSIQMQMRGLLECLSDFSSTGHALQHAPAPDGRSSLLNELAGAAVSLIQPAIDAIDESTSASAAATAASEAAMAAAAAAAEAAGLVAAAGGAEGEAVAEEATAAAPEGAGEDESSPAAMQAASDSAAQMAATAAAAAKVSMSTLPLSQHVELTKLCHRCVTSLSRPFAEII